MKSVLVLMCTVLVTCRADESRVEENPMYRDIRDRVRYIKDSGVDKIVDRRVTGDVWKDHDIIALRHRNVKEEDVNSHTSNVNNNASEITNSTLDKNDTASNSMNLENKSLGVPVYITDDGKTIHLPQSELLYNPKTGEILIRNKEHHDVSSIETDNKEIPKDSFHVQKQEDHEIQNLKGFVIDEDKTKNKVLLPVTVPTVDKSKTTETLSAHSESTTVDSEIITTKQVGSTLETSTESRESTTSNVLSTTEKSDQPVTNSISEIEYTTQEQETTTKLDVTHKPLDEMTTKEEIPLALTKSTKLAMGRSNDKVFDTKEINRETEKNNETNEYSETDSAPIEVKIHSKTEDLSKEAIENVIKNNLQKESIVASVNLEENSSDGFDDSSDQNNVARMMKIDEIDERLNKEIELELRNSYSTTTEKPVDHLRKLLEDMFLRGPIAILVDVEPKNLVRTRELWNTMETQGGSLDTEDVVLFGYDIDGITAMSYHKGTKHKGLEVDIKSLTRALSGMTSTSKYYSGPGNPRMALNKAIQLLPYDSAIFVFEADRLDPNIYRGGAQTPVPAKLTKQLITKRIKLYSISSGQSWAGSAALKSGGATILVPTAPQPSPSPPLHSTEKRLHHDLLQDYSNIPHYREMRALSMYYDTDDSDEIVYDEQQILVLAHNITGTTKPVVINLDSGIKILTVNITGRPDKAILRGPHNTEINLLDETSVKDFTAGSKRLSTNQSDFLCVSLALSRKYNGARLLDEEEEEMNGGEASEYHGAWKLYLQSGKPMDVQVTADTNLRIMAKLTGGNQDTANNLKIAVGGTVASIRDTEIVDIYGNHIGKIHTGHRHEEYSENDTVEIEAVRALESGTVVKHVDLPAELRPNDLFRVRVMGRNDKDEEFVRISSILATPAYVRSTAEELPVELLQQGSNLLNQSFTEDRKGNLEVAEGGMGYDSIDGGRAYNGSLMRENQQVIGSTTLETQPLTFIQIGIASKLYGAPGSVFQIHFEVTNRRENAVFYRFGARDDKYYLRSLSPQGQWVNAGQTLNVVLTVGITSSAENNARDTITFTATSYETTSINLYVYVETEGQISSDRTRPTLRHEFIGDCMGFLGDDDCRKRFWGLEIIARDTESGVARIAATPGLVYYQNNFHAGGRDEARARFSGNCCIKQVIVSATDVAGNLASYEVNVAYYFTPASIAAITLGVVLAVILIIVIVLLIRMCIKKRQTSRDLPSYSTQRS